MNSVFFHPVFIFFCLLRPWILQQIEECANTHHLGSSSEQKSKGQKLSFFFALSSHCFSICSPALCTRAARGSLSVMRHYLWAKMCGRSCTSSYTAPSQVHPQDAISSTHTVQWTISGTYNIHRAVCSERHRLKQMFCLAGSKNFLPTSLSSVGLHS